MEKYIYFPCGKKGTQTNIIMAFLGENRGKIYPDTYIYVHVSEGVKQENFIDSYTMLTGSVLGMGRDGWEGQS